MESQFNEVFTKLKDLLIYKIKNKDCNFDSEYFYNQIKSKFSSISSPALVLALKYKKDHIISILENDIKKDKENIIQMCNMETTGLSNSDINQIAKSIISSVIHSITEDDNYPKLAREWNRYNKSFGGKTHKFRKTHKSKKGTKKSKKGTKKRSKKTKKTKKSKM
jgi:hypothetical protein